MLLVIASTHTNRHRYEDIADALFGKRYARFTSIMNLLCLMAFIMSYIVYVKKNQINTLNVDQRSHSQDHYDLCTEFEFFYS